MKKFFCILACVAFAPSVVFAQTQKNDFGLSNTADAAGLVQGFESDASKIVGNVIGTALSMIAVLFFILTLYGGFVWMTARGNEESTKKALNIITAAVIGIIVVLSAYAITRFVFQSVEPGFVQDRDVRTIRQGECPRGVGHTSCQYNSIAGSCILSPTQNGTCQLNTTGSQCDCLP